MASLLLNAAPVDYQDSININKNEQSSNFSKKQPKNKTIKNENNKKLKAEMLKAEKLKAEMLNFSDSDSDDDLENFKPVQEENIKMNNNPLNSLNYNNNSEEYVSDYYKNYLKNVQANNNLESISNNELLKKLDNILYLLEDQNEEKNSYVTEELILYIFLGVFIIYVLDSFVRVGKYTR